MCCTFLCLDNITQIKQKCNTFFIFYKDYLKYIFQEYLRQAPQAPGTGAFYSILLCEARQAANRGRALKDFSTSDFGIFISSAKAAATACEQLRPLIKFSLADSPFVIFISFLFSIFIPILFDYLYYSPKTKSLPEFEAVVSGA